MRSTYSMIELADSITDHNVHTTNPSTNRIGPANVLLMFLIISWISQQQRL